MILNVWILLTLISLGTLWLALTAAQDEISLIVSVISTILWLVSSYGALNLETYSENQDAYVTQSEPAIAVIVLIGVLICVINAGVIIFDWFEDIGNDTRR